MTTKTRRAATLALTLMGSLAAQAALACTAPPAPASLPDGRTALLAALQESRLEVERYVQQVEVYFQCEHNALKLQEVSEREKAVVNSFNSTVIAFLRTNRVAAARPVGNSRR